MKVLAVLFLASLVSAKHEVYSGWKSYYVNPSTQEQLASLGQLIPYLELDFISYASVNRPGVVLVKPYHQEKFIKFLEEENIDHWVHSEDVKESLDIDDAIIEEINQKESKFNGVRIPYNNYQPLEVIYQYIDMIAEKYPEVATLVTPANSFGGIPIKYLKISKNKFQGNKPVIIIDAAMHAREWITPPTVTYAIHKLVENVTEPDLLENFDWILLPVANPDGYKYSFEKERFWRKTRSTDQHPTSRLCPGVDGNRNFNFVWNTIGTSNNPCSDIYAGARPHSEIEVRVVENIITEHLDNALMYLTMHSFGSYILYPWGHDGSLPPNAFALHLVGVEMADAITNVQLPNFPKYRVGNAVTTLGYPASGAAEDYAHMRGVPLSYTYELPGLRSGFQGFHLDPRYIRQVSEETWIGIVAGVRRSLQFASNK
ncbi:carboxypeptidase B-like [Danaus plexippus]|uniref:carboxypeptidase B-like n=1 Tax=Danaus plexippus TaxID=13037 RepID=UPI002AB2322B|nr:carboxypeptidase B-like [Danaus plexippus]